MKKLTIIAALSLIPSTALAYPTAVVFSPSGEARSFLNVGLVAYTATNFSPHVSPSASWFGAQIGMLPQWKYGDSGLSFGGLEGGFDIITPFTTADGQTLVKPVLNFKLGLVTEGKYTPSVAIGMMEISPALPSMNYAYVAMSKNIRADKDATTYGRVTLGYGFNAGARDQFNGTFPFSNTRSALMAAYETPLIWDRWGFMVEYLGGSSEISDTYIGTVLNLSNTTSIAGGAFISNDRTAPANDGAYFTLSKAFDIIRLSTPAASSQ
jgi:hypothetical protein